MNSTPKITLDSNCIINLFDHASTSATSVEDIIELIRLSHSSKVDIAVTTRVEADLMNDRNDVRRLEMLKNIRMFPTIGTVARYGVSTLNGGDVFGGKESGRISEELRSILFPGGIDPESATFSNKINDIDHLLGHLINRRDIFVTDDQGILKKKQELKMSPGISAMAPGEVLKFIENLESNRKVTELQISTEVPGYFSKSHQGIVSFDYSNNHGNFTIGGGVYTFETKWSKASDTRIHSYNDAPSIKCIALVKDVGRIADIDDASLYDFSSRSRTIKEGQILLLKNINGVYAAIKIIEVKDDNRSSKENRLTFEYSISSIGETCFKDNKGDS